MQLDLALKERVRERLRSFEALRAGAAHHHAAAVAVTLVAEGLTGAQLPGIESPASWSDEAALILTRRRHDLRHHGGQWALPGGRIDAGEDAAAAALRELQEEVGLSVDSAEVLGCLDDFVTRSGFVMTPVVVWGGAATSLDPNPDEVASIHRIPVREFMRSDSPMLEATDDAARPVLRMPVGDAWIAAPTAAIIYQFREVCIAGRETRVAHFDQPAFAWR